MPILSVDNQITATSVASQTLNVTFSGTRVNILAVAGPQGPPGIDGTGGGVLNLTGLFPLYYDQGSGIMGVLSGYYAQYSQLTGASGALVSQISVNSAGVTSLNDLSGTLTAVGTGNLFVFASGSRLIISGSGLAYVNDLTGYVPTSRQINGHVLTGNATIVASDIPVSIVPGAGYSNLQQFINVMHSPGLINGAFITDAGSGIAQVGRGTGMLRVADDDVSSLLFVDIPASGLAIPMDIQQYYVGFVYNSGNPIFELRAVDSWNKDTEIPLGTVVNYFGQLVITNNPFLVGDPITNIIQRFDAMAPVTRDETVGGLLLGELATRYITLSAGVLWTRLNDYDVIARDTSITDILYSASYNGVSWDYATPLVQWPNTQYNDTNIGLVTMTDGYYANLWFYCGVENGSLGFVYGQAEWGSLTDAAAEQAPGLLPDNFLTTNVLVARLTFLKGGASSSQISSAFATTFTTSPVSTHNTLGGLQGGASAQYYHLTSQDFTSLTGIADRLALSSYLHLTSTVSGASLDIGAGGRLGVSAFTGVTEINGITGGISIVGAGNTSVVVAGTSIIVSGDTGSYNSFALKSDLTVTGETLQNRINNISGWVTGTVSGSLDTRIIATGALTASYINSLGTTLSGQLTATGAILGTKVDALSGYVDSTLVHKTGDELVSGAKTFQITSASGFYINSGNRNIISVTPSTFQIIQTNGNPIFNSAQTQLWDSSANFALNWGGRYAQDENAAIVFDWTNKVLADSSGLNSINWTNRQLLASPGSPMVLDWANRFISGEWQTNTAGSQSGSLINYHRFTGWIGSLSGFSLNTFATIANLAATGSNLQEQIYTLTGLGTSLAFDIGRNIVVPSGTGSVAVTFSRDLGGVPLVIPVLVNDSGDPTLAYYPSGVTTSGFMMVLSANASTAGYRINYLATTGSGWLVLGQSTGGNEIAQFQITQTGIQLIARDNAISGVLNTSIIGTGVSAVLHANGIGMILSGNITQTGVQLINRDNAISGGLEARIAITGNSTVTHANSIGIVLSGGLTTTGQTLQSRIDLLSGNLIQTGVQLTNRDNSISGGLEVRLVATGNAAVAHANVIGGIISGNLTQTGLQIGLLSGAIATKLANTGAALWQRDLDISGALEIRIATTGSSAIMHANSVGDILSGKLTQTGVQLLNIIGQMSGIMEQSFVHRTGAELVSGRKTFASGINITNSTGGMPPTYSSDQLVVHVSNAEGTAPAMMLDGINAGGLYEMRRAAGTLASPSALVNGTLMGTIGWRGYGATDYSNRRATINSLTTETWTDSSQGTKFTFTVTPTGTTNTATPLHIFPTRVVASGDLSISGSIGIGAATISLTGASLYIDRKLTALGHQVSGPYSGYINVPTDASINGLYLGNPLAATTGGQRYSPFIEQEGFGYDILNGSKSIRFRHGVKPALNFNDPIGDFVIEVSVNSGTYTELFRATSDGSINMSSLFSNDSVETSNALITYGNTLILVDAANTGALNIVTNGRGATGTLTLDTNGKNCNARLLGDIIISGSLNSITFGTGGMGDSPLVCNLNGGSGVFGGAYTSFQRNGVTQGAIGTESVIIGNNSNALAVWGGNNDVKFWAGGGGNIMSLTTNGLAITGSAAVSTFIKLPGLTVSSLPTASSAGMGAMSSVIDATVNTRLSVAVGGGSNRVIVFSDATNWLIL